MSIHLYEIPISYENNQVQVQIQDSEENKANGDRLWDKKVVDEKNSRKSNLKKTLIFGFIFVVIFFTAVMGIVVGIFSHEAMINKKNFYSVEEQLSNLTYTLKHLQTQFATNNISKNAALPSYFLLANGWMTPLNGYEYKVTPNKQNWQNSRRVCQGMGGDLAVYGVQHWSTRLLIINALKINNKVTWIGLRDIQTEGEWRWINGEFVTDRTTYWNPGEPDNNRNADCGNMNPRCNDAWCTDQRLALCEKKLKV